MVNRNLIRELDVGADRWEAELEEAFGGTALEELEWTEGDVNVNEIVPGKILRVDREFVAVDVGYKSEGLIPLNEWEDEEEPVIGETINVLVEDIEDQSRFDDPRGMILLSKRKAEKIEVWQKVMETVAEGDIVTGQVTRKIKGGLLVDIGVNVFLPASQVDIRRPADIGDYIGRTVQCVVLKIDEGRRNIVVSRRALIEVERAEKKSQLFSELQIGQKRVGVVKNIADFGAFVDLGGVDGLLHITDMSWGRIGHPSEMVAIDQELEIVILNIDYEREKIALGLKQLKASPWDNIETKYPVNEVVEGEVVNVMSYGAFVKLEDGIEGLVHISEMSWTKRVSHPSELVGIGDKVKVVVLNIDKDKQEISLGMKQTQDNPWDKVAERYGPGTVITGRVRNLTNYGAFIEIEEGIDGLLHVSDMSWTRKIGHPSEMVDKGEEITCKVISVDQERRRIALGLKQMDEDPWARRHSVEVPAGPAWSKARSPRSQTSACSSGLEDGLEGLLHISELAEDKVENPEQIVNLDDEIEVKVLRVDTEERKIGLSRKRVDWAEEDEQAAAAEEAAAKAAAKPQAELKGGIGGGAGPLFSAGGSTETPENAEAAAPATEDAAESSEDATEES